MPLRESPDVLGESYNIEKKGYCKWKANEKKPKLCVEYNKFMQEYERLGHMHEIKSPSRDCFLPHHAVIRENSVTIKLRAVFDASAETSSGVSLNNIQYVDPVVQDDLFSILLRFRQHKYVVTADVEKMYH